MRRYRAFRAHGSHERFAAEAKAPGAARRAHGAARTLEEELQVRRGSTFPSLSIDISIDLYLFISFDRYLYRSLFIYLYRCISPPALTFCRATVRTDFILRSVKPPREDKNVFKRSDDLHLIHRRRADPL